MINFNLLVYCSFYLVCVVPLEKSGELPKDKGPDDYFKKVRRREAEKVEAPFIAAKFLFSQLPDKFFVGDESFSNSYGYSNKKLTRGHYYTVFLRAYVNNQKGVREFYFVVVLSLTPSVSLLYFAVQIKEV